MVDLKYEITSLPDYPALQQLARALWRDGSVRGASVLVGAGLSKNAGRPAEEFPEPPLWFDLLQDMIERLYPHDPKAAPSSPLRIAEEYRTYFGQAGLDDFIRTRFPDKSWTPGPLHNGLLELPWTDVLTTNWDTLLERAAANSIDISYDIVRAEEDLTYAKSPRIVKLHGTIGDSRPLIFAEDDYRTYPAKFAAFVNFARQVFIENELCLVGFSGDDPNFLQWAGWVRDHLGGSARRIYLVGNLRLEQATRRYLEAHNIAPIDFTPLVKELPRNLQHAEATRIFIDELRKAKPPPRHEWQLTPSEQFPLFRAGGTAYERVHKDPSFAAELLADTVLLFKADRERYPGWLVCPSRYRETLLHAGDVHWLLRKPVLNLLDPSRRAEAAFEILWRRTTSLSPLDAELAAALTELAETKLPNVTAEMRKDFALALIRDARTSYDDAGINRWATIIESEADADSAILQESLYQQCLRARDRMDLTALQTQLAGLTSEEPVWKLRRAALHTEIGEHVKATKLIKDAAVDLQRRFRLDRNSLSIKSQLAWAAWLNRGADMWSTRWNELPQLRDFSEFGIDPQQEVERINDRAAEIERKLREDSETIRPAFEPGHYRDGSETIRFGFANSGIALLHEFDQLTEIIGLPIRINNVNICANAALAATEAATQSNVEWYIWLLRALHDQNDRSFERNMSRVAVARLSPTTSAKLISIVESAVSFWANRLREAKSLDLRDDFTQALHELRLLLLVLSRLTVWMSPEQATAIFHRAAEMAKDPQLWHFWIIEALGELAKFAAASVPPNNRGFLALSAIEFPLPSEKGTNIPSWPRLVTAIWNTKPDRDTSDTRWDHRISQLLSAAQKGHPDREHAILRLVYLTLKDALKPNEASAFGKVLWSDVDTQEHALPQNTGLSQGLLLRLPADNGINVEDRLRARIFCIDVREAMNAAAPTGSVEIGAKIETLNSVAMAIESGLSLPADVAARMFDEIVVWQPRPSNRQDPLAELFIRRFNDNIRYAAGHLLATGVVTALPTEQRTELRALNLMTFITQTRSWAALSALPPFLASSQDAAVAITSAIRRGLVGLESQHVGHAALAVSNWAKLARNGNATELPRTIVDQLISAVESCRETGLSALIDTTRTLLEKNFLQEYDLERLLQALSIMRSVFRYEDVAQDSLRAASVSLVRAACVKLSAALEGRITDIGILQDWKNDAKSDPLPEVRFATGMLASEAN